MINVVAKIYGEVSECLTINLYFRLIFNEIYILFQQIDQDIEDIYERLRT